MKQPSRVKRCLFAAVMMLGAYLIVEGAVSTYAWFTWYDSSLNILEDGYGTIQFDAARGYRLGPSLARQVRIINGRVEHVSMFRGNAEGFAGRQDFGRSRLTPGITRIAVFGDSFSHAPYLSQNWPDRVADRTRAEGEPLQVLNFSLCAIGLANWWSTITKVVEADDYELDGVIFAVYEGNLVRSFLVQAAPEVPGPGHSLSCGRCPSWNPRDFPATLDDARPYLEEYQQQHLVTREEFERALQGEWPSSVPRRFRPVVLRSAYQFVRTLGAGPPGGPEVAGDFDDDRKRLISDIRRFLDVRHLPALVVHIPSRDTLLGLGRESTLHRDKCERFAAALGATFLDGEQAFTGLDARGVRAHFFPYDGHWNQKGSDRFADFVLNNAGEFFRSSGSRNLSQGPLLARPRKQ